LLLNHGCSIESRDYRGLTALHYAAEHNHAETTKILLDNELDPYLENSRGNTAFHQAAQTGSEKVMKILLDNGFNVDTKSGPYKATALLCAVENMSLRAIEVLLDYDASVNTIDALDRTSLHYAVQKDALEIAEILLNKRVAVNAMDYICKSALDYVVEDDNLPIVAILVRSGASIMKSVPPKEGRLAQYLTQVVRAIEQTSANELFNTSSPIRHEERDMELTHLKLREILVIINEENQSEFKSTQT
jgi:ankyrin repeat protein